MKILFIDRHAEKIELFSLYIDQYHNINWAINDKQAKKEISIQNRVFDLVFIDYALETGTGSEVISMLSPKAINSHLYNTLFVCHSLDMAGNLGMYHRLMDRGYRAVMIPFSSLMVELKYTVPNDGEIIRAFHTKWMKLSTSPKL